MNPSAPHPGSSAPPTNNPKAKWLPGRHIQALEQMDYGVLISLFLVTLLFLPVIIAYFRGTVKRWKEGWILKGGNSTFIESETKAKTKPTPRSPSSFLINARYLYNHFLLKDIPILKITIGQALVCAIFVPFFIYGLVSNNGVLLLQQNRPQRFGVIAAGFLPFVYAFGSKNTLVSLAGKGHEKLNIFHRWTGFLVVVFGVLHGGLYLKRLGDRYTFFHSKKYGSGTVGMAALLFIYFTSIPPIRRYAYEIFLYCHIIGWVTLLAAINVHVEIVRPLTWAVVAIYSFDLLSRVAKTRVHKVKLFALEDEMTRVEIEGVSDGWRAGQHLWLRVGNKRFLEAHPFTIANAPTSSSPFRGKQSLQLYVKTTGGFTRSLHELAATVTTLPEGKGKLSYQGEKLDPLDSGEKEKSGSKDLEKTDQMSARVVDSSNSVHEEGVELTALIHGPYGGLMYNDTTTCEAVLIAVGGSGITFGLSILEDAVYQMKSGHARTRKVVFVWAARHLGTLTWVKERLISLGQVAAAENVDLQIHVYLTGAETTTVSPQIPFMIVHHGRPHIVDNLASLIDEMLVDSSTRKGGILLATCGPRGLVLNAKEAVVSTNYKRFCQVGGITFHSETFGW